MEAGENPLRKLVEGDMREIAVEEGGRLLEAWERASEADSVYLPCNIKDILPLLVQAAPGRKVAVQPDWLAHLLVRDCNRLWK